MTDFLDRALAAAPLGRPLLDRLNKHLAEGEQAEKAVARVRAYADRLDQLADATVNATDRSLYRGIAADLRAALDPKQGPK